MELLTFMWVNLFVSSDFFLINNLLSEVYLSLHLFLVCMDFFGQLIAQPRSMPGILTVPPP